MAYPSFFLAVMKDFRNTSEDHDQNKKNPVTHLMVILSFIIENYIIVGDGGWVADVAYFSPLTSWRYSCGEANQKFPRQGK